MSSMSTKAMAKRFQTLGFRPEAYVPIMRLIQRWANDSGEEWTVARLKEYRQLFLHWVDYQDYTPECRIELRSGLPVGPFRHFFRSRSLKWFCKAWSALMVYTGFTSQRLTLKQAKKFISGVQRDQPEHNALAEARSLIALGLRSFPRIPPPAPLGAPLTAWPIREEKLRKVMGITVSEPESVLEGAYAMLSSSMGAFRSCIPLVMGTLRPLMPYQKTWGEHRMGSVPVIGRLGLIQEPGYKARFVASPEPVYQSLTKPLYSWLRSVCEGLPYNWQFDQKAGVAYVRDVIHTRRWVQSTDLSGATDHFPLSLQLDLLTMLGCDDQWIELMRVLSSALWEVPNAIRETLSKVGSLVHGQYIRWMYGQPLGLLPSFNLFSATHYALCEGICLNHGHQSNSGLFSIVGDDVVWFETECAADYTRVMSNLGVPISSHKTLTSTSIGEFLSRIITPTHIVPSYKWREPSDESFVDLALLLGPRSLPLFRKRQRKVLRAIARWPEPWGLGWNPKGEPLWVRESSVPRKDVELGDVSVLSTGSRLARLWYLPQIESERYKQLGMGIAAAHQLDVYPFADQAKTEFLWHIFGFVAKESVLQSALATTFLNLSILAMDEFGVGMQRVRPGVVDLLPGPFRKELCSREPIEQMRYLKGLVHRFREVFGLELEHGGHIVTLIRYERMLELVELRKT